MWVIGGLSVDRSYTGVGCVGWGRCGFERNMQEDHRQIIGGIVLHHADEFTANELYITRRYTAIFSLLLLGECSKGLDAFRFVYVLCRDVV